MCVFCLSSHSDLGGFIESVDPVDKVLLIIGLQEELPHPSIDDLQVTKKEHWEQKKKWKYILLSQSGYNTPSELQTNTHTKTYYIQRHIEVCFQPFLVSVSGHIHRHRFLWKWKTTEPRDSPTHTQQHFLCMAMMTQLDSAVSVCHHLPTSNHERGYQQPNILTRFYSHEHEKTAFQSWRNFWVKCWLAMDQDLDAERTKVSFLSGFAINPSVLQLKPSLCLLYFLLTP